MRRTLTSLLTLAAVISLPLLIITLILYPRSYWYADSFWFNSPNHARAAVTTTGHLKLISQRVNPSAPYTITANTGHRAQPPSDPRPDLRTSDDAIYFAGFAYTSSSHQFGHARALLLPLWSLTLLSATPPALLLYTLRRHRRLHRQQQNLCPHCAYDLRATPDRCPECGYAMPTRSSTRYHKSCI